MIKCAEGSCQKPLNDLDVKQMGLNSELVKQYEKFSLHNAIAQMDDMGWCPLQGCTSLAIYDLQENTGRCQHCEFLFCLDCKKAAHPFKRCLINRIDLNQQKYEEEIKEINERNQEYEKQLTAIFFKYCTKPCPNPKCKVPISKDEGGCTHVQCTRCFTWICWACGGEAKGQMHFKQNPEHLREEGTLLPATLTDDLIQQHMGLSQSPYINIKHCASCPGCKNINMKKGKGNLFSCQKCSQLFCFICNKAVKGPEHFESSNCHAQSEIWNDM